VDAANIISLKRLNLKVFTVPTNDQALLLATQITRLNLTRQVTLFFQSTLTALILNLFGAPSLPTIEFALTHLMGLASLKIIFDFDLAVSVDVRVGWHVSGSRKFLDKPN